MRGAITGFFLVTSLALHAKAEETFPTGIQEAAGVPCAPTCLLCHTAIPGNIGNLKQPFGLAVLGSGVIPGKPDSLSKVVANLRAKKTDTDRDGQLDVDELAAGTNPNDPDPNAQLCGPRFGCGAHIAISPPPSGRAPTEWWLAGALALTGLIGARRWRPLRGTKRYPS